MARLFRKKEEGKKSLWDRIVDVALTDVTVLVKGLDEGSLEGLEETLIAADFGVPSTLRLVQVVETLAERGVARSQRDFLRAVREEIVAILRAGRSDTALRFNYEGGPTVFLVVGVNGVGKTTTIAKLAMVVVFPTPFTVFLVVGVNGVGKTTTIAKLAHRLTRQGRKVMIAAGDTAGRLHTQNDLMKELEKVQRVIGKKMDGAPHETLIVLDSTVGQNAMAQIRTFGQTLPLTGIVLTKMDGTAKGGIVVALKEEFDLPVKFIGVGEKMDDLLPFEVEAFAEEVLEA